MLKLYHHKTSGGAEYLFDTFLQTDYCKMCDEVTRDNGSENCEKCGSEKHKEGVLNDSTKYIVRIDGDITKDAELTVRD